MLLPQGREGADSISFFVMIVMAPSGQNDHSHQQCHQRFVAKDAQGCRAWGWGPHGTQLQKRQTNHISHQELSWWPSTSPWISMANCKPKTIFFDRMQVFSPFQTVAFLGPDRCIHCHRLAHGRPPATGITANSNGLIAHSSTTNIERGRNSHLACLVWEGLSSN